MPARRSDRTRAAILDAAREQFAAHGYERVTIRSIAADAAIDASMVMRYYGNKDKLFAAAAEFDLELPDLTLVPRTRVGATLVQHFVDRWDRDETLAALLRAAASNAAAVERINAIFGAQLVPVVAALHPPGTQPDEIATRAALVGTQILGMAFCRYVVRLPPLVAMDRTAVLAWLAPTLRRYLVGAPPG